MKPRVESLIGETPETMSAKLNNKCLLCGSKAFVFGIWTPTPKVCKQAGISEKHAIGYVLCEQCVMKPDAPVMAEDALLKWLAGYQN